MRRCLPIAILALVALLAGCTDDSGPESAPEVTVEATPREGPAPLTVEFGTSVVFGDVEDFSYRWDFGDGEQSTEAAPSHTYAEEGIYHVTAEVTDNEGGATGTDQTVVDVGPRDPSVQTTEPGGGEAVPLADWVDEVNAACAATAEAAAEIQPAEGTTTLTAEQWAQIAELQRTETEAIEAAGTPDTDLDEIEAWFDSREEWVGQFQTMIAEAPVQPDDPRWATLDTMARDLSEQSRDLGLDDCAGG